jgi:hypothetical protein
MTEWEWNGRPVVFADFDLRQGRAVRKAFAEDGETGSYLCLVSSLRYAETGEPVFASVDEVWQLPFKMQQRVLRLAGQAARVNGMLDTDDDGERVATNGSGEPVGPSH